ncbi:MAG: short-chain dehydrogenase/reductase [Flavobacteriaceae bacterium]|nr:short-chain dehydrogenase/reductase [Flavobacteriaceae bacterium]
MKKVILITGASSGFGKIIAEKLSNNGNIVFGTSRNPKKYPKPNNYKLIKFDITSFDDSKLMVNSIVNQTGKIDILINNAGIGFTGPIEEISIDNVKKVFDTNFIGQIAIIQSVLPIMRSNQSGLIINITSIAGYHGLPFVGVYSASKASMEFLGESLNMELNKFGIRVVNIAPGDYKTEIINNRNDTKINQKSPYFDIYNQLIKKWNSNMNVSRDPIEVANLVQKIIKSKNPRIHYVIGSFIQRFSILLKKILPEKIYERLLMNHYKL